MTNYKSFNIIVKKDRILVQYLYGGLFVSYPSLKVAKKAINMYISGIKAGLL